MTYDMFYKYNYYDRLSGSDKIAYEHAQQSNNSSKLDLHKIRIAMYEQYFSDVICPEWLVENQRPNYTTCTNQHVTDNSDTLNEVCKTSLNRKILIHNNYGDSV